MYEYESLKPVKVILLRGRGKRDNSGGDEPHQDTLYTYIEMPQQSLLYH
jgi:hypothetical protein